MKLKWDSRVMDALALAKDFITETEYPITYSDQNSRDYFWKLLNDSNTAVFIDYGPRGNTLHTARGLIIVHADPEFSNESFGYISKMYVQPKFRGTGTGRALLREACEWFDQQQCVLSFATATGGIGQDKLYTNLLAKFGFVETGMVLIRKGNLT